MKTIVIFYQLPVFLDIVLGSIAPNTECVVCVSGDLADVQSGRARGTFGSRRQRETLPQHSARRGL